MHARLAHIDGRQPPTTDLLGSGIPSKQVAILPQITMGLMNVLNILLRFRPALREVGRRAAEVVGRYI
jgi:hypothetical protein